MRDSSRPPDDTKDMMIGGCRVHLTYGQTDRRSALVCKRDHTMRD
jgi:hypothetical protein